LVIGINGAQGAGKSTLFNLLEVILTEGFDLKVVGFSIDDLYKTFEKRVQLSEEVHPLLKTRGVPGTHDVDLGIEILNSLKSSTEESITKIPVFDKSTDDRCPASVWQEWIGPADVIVFEGWCVGALPQEPEQLVEAINDLERDEDPDGAWRDYVNTQLSGIYQEMFSMIEVLIMLKVPSMDSVFEWRSLQEKKLAERVKYIYDTQQPTEHLRIMNEEQIKRFIQHYERLTQQMLEEMPDRADVTLFLNDNHKISDIQINNPLASCG
jgi:D-glycerate 3-kinase